MLNLKDIPDYNSHFSMIFDFLTPSYELLDYFKVENAGEFTGYFFNTEKEIKDLVNYISIKTDLPFFLWDLKITSDRFIDGKEVCKFVCKSYLKTDKVQYEAVVYETMPNLGIPLLDSYSYSKPYNTAEEAQKKAKRMAWFRDIFTFGSRTGIKWEVNPILTRYYL